MTKAQTREEWLRRLTDSLRPLFGQHGAKVPKRVRASCGWPSKRAMAKSKRRIGECWSNERSADKHHEIFISPTLSKPIKVAETLVHELVHAAIGIECGHKAPFRRLALAIGLEGKMTATHAGQELHDTLKRLTTEAGPYPHGEVSFDQEEKKQSTRLLKVECANCGYVVRVTQKWLDVGVPTCPCGHEMEAV